MKNINIQDQLITFEISSSDNNYKNFLDWVEIVNNNQKEDEWVELEILKGIHFKNLKIVQDDIQIENSKNSEEVVNDIQISFICDEWVTVE